MVTLGYNDRSSFGEQRGWRGRRGRGRETTLVALSVQETIIINSYSIDSLTLKRVLVYV